MPDKRQLHIAGLSNGGRAVSYLPKRHGPELASAVFISPVFGAASIASTSFAAGWRARPILVITGAEDDRVPISYVEESVATMRSAGIAVRLYRFEHANHFLVFSRRTELIAQLTDWLDSNSRHLSAPPTLSR
jgi:pimeloyl-ACP methyl ester carboxylesterase